ncbi:MAG: hypothetical protein ACI4GC_04940 [Acutalibacteraceae bacterium]
MAKKNNNNINNNDPYNFDKIEAPQKEQAQENKNEQPVMGKSYQKGKNKNKQ